MKNIFFLLLVCVLMSVCYPAEVKNEDKPLKGNLLFKMEKVREIDSADGDILANIKQILVTDNGWLYIHDSKNMKYYIYDDTGKYIGKFGKSGEGPGEIREIDQARIFSAAGNVAVQDSFKLHFYTKTGGYISSYPNFEHRRPPVLFLTGDEFISAPTSLTGARDGKGTISLVNLKTGKKKAIYDFSVFKGGVVGKEGNRATLTSAAMVPGMIIGYYKKQIYFGYSGKYRVMVMDMNGKELKSFSLTRKKRPISTKRIKEVLFEMGKGKAPESVLSQLAESLPNELTHFSNIEIHNGLVYLHMSYFQQENSQKIDIFSPEGKYLYAAEIRIPKGITITSMPTLKGGYAYLAIENEEGEQAVRQYKITLPKE
ncbi:MAG: 6-bladed beta-propeller [bacterium]|nr:6-bladed beta-propeller [bacterium]